MQLWQLSSSSSLAITAITAQLHQQRSNLQQFQLRQPCSHAAVQPCSHAALQPCSLAACQPCSLSALQPVSLAAPLCSLAASGNSTAALEPCGFAVTMKSLT